VLGRGGDPSLMRRLSLHRARAVCGRDLRRPRTSRSRGPRAGSVLTSACPQCRRLQVARTGWRFTRRAAATGGCGRFGVACAPRTPQQAAFRPKCDGRRATGDGRRATGGSGRYGVAGGPTTLPRLHPLSGHLSATQILEFARSMGTRRRPNATRPEDRLPSRGGAPDRPTARRPPPAPRTGR
jgi:hypothetical protein